MPDNILSIRNVTKRFGGLVAVDNVSFDVTRGDLLGISGPNGSGKSTLFNVLSRIPYGLTSGTVAFNGQRIDKLAAHKIATIGLTRTFQQDVEFADLSAQQTVSLAGTYACGLGSSSAAKAAAEQLDFIGFDPARRALSTTELSIYERKQLMLGSALVMQPKVLMLDEPASGLTRPEIAALEALLLKINTSGVTILLIEHVLSLLLAVSQRLIVLNHGSILADGKPDVVMRKPAVVEAYLGKRKA